MCIICRGLSALLIWFVGWISFFVVYATSTPLFVFPLSWLLGFRSFSVHTIIASEFSRTGKKILWTIDYLHVCKLQRPSIVGLTSINTPAINRYLVCWLDCSFFVVYPLVCVPTVLVAWFSFVFCAQIYNFWIFSNVQKKYMNNRLPPCVQFTEAFRRWSCCDKSIFGLLVGWMSVLCYACY